MRGRPSSRRKGGEGTRQVARRAQSPVGADSHHWGDAMAPENDSPILEPDELVEKLVPDPSGPVQDVLVLIGWVGRSTREGHVRLYLAADLSEYVSFRTADVVHTARMPAEQAGVAATRVWLRKSAEIQQTRRVPSAVARQFLGGPVASSFLSRFGRFAGGISLGNQGGVLVSVPPEASVCFSCPTSGGEDTCVPATCTLSTSCQTQFLCV